MPHSAGQVRVYLFRKLSASLSEPQRAVCEEAVAEVLGQVLGGHTSSIFCCGRSDAGDDPEDVVARILGVLFSQPEQPEVSVRYVRLSDEPHDLAAILTSCGARRTPLDHLVATQRDLQAYVDRVKGDVVEESECRHLIFTVLVSQKTSIDCGQLQLVHLKPVGEDTIRPTDNESESDAESLARSVAAKCEAESVDKSVASKSESESPLEALGKLLQALGHNTKTHLRYHNVRLTRLLRQLLGNCGRTVIINFTDEPRRWEPVVVSPSRIYHDELTAAVWQAMYRRERRKYCCLREKVLSQGEDKLKEMEEFLESLEGGESPEEVGENTAQEQDLMQQKMVLICTEAEHTIGQLADLRADHEHLAEQSRRQEQQLAQKNRQLARLSQLLTSAREELRAQRLQFKHKLAEDLGRLSSLCRLQSKMQLQVHRRHLSEVFDLVLQEKQQQTPWEDEETDDEPPERP